MSVIKNDQLMLCIYYRTYA